MYHPDDMTSSSIAVFFVAVVIAPTSASVTRRVVGACNSRPSLSAAVNRSEYRRVNISNAVDVGAVCNDRSSGFYYLSRTLNSSRWVVFLEGGVGCARVTDCNVRYVRSPHLMSSHLYPQSIEGRDILDSDPNVNPSYWNYNFVLLPYCTSDLWIGNSTWNESETEKARAPFQFDFHSKTNQFAFRGSAVFRAAIRELLLYHDLSAAEDVSQQMNVVCIFTFRGLACSSKSVSLYSCCPLSSVPMF